MTNTSTNKKLKFPIIVLICVSLIFSGGCKKKVPDYDNMGDDIAMEKNVTTKPVEEKDVDLDPPVIYSISMQDSGYEKIIQGYFDETQTPVKLKVSTVNSKSDMIKYINLIKTSLTSGAVDGFYIDSNNEAMARMQGLLSQTRNINGMINQYAPSYYAMLLDKNIPIMIIDAGEYIPVGIIGNDPHANRITLAVKSELAKEYDKDINTVDDYIELLYFAKERGYICPTYIVDQSVLLALCAQDNGYYMVDDLLNANINTFSMAKFNETEPKNIEFLINNDDVINTLNKFSLANKDKLINTTEDITNMASFILRKKDITLYQPFVVMFGELTTFTLYDDNPYASPIVNEYGKLFIAENAQNPVGVVEFIEYINLNQENYDLYRYGKLDTNYKLVGQQYQSLATGARVMQYIGYLTNTSFINTTYERSSVGIPADFNSQFDKIMPSQNISLNNIGQNSIDNISDMSKELYTEDILDLSSKINSAHMTLAMSVFAPNDFLESIESVKGKYSMDEWNKIIEIYEKLFNNK